MTSESEPPAAATDTGTAAFESARWSLTEQFRAIEGLDAKAERLFAGAVALVGLYGAVAALTVERGHEATAVASLVIGLPVLASFAYAAVEFLRGYRISEWSAGPPNEAMLRVAGDYAERQVRLWLVEEFVSSYEENLDGVARKARHFRGVLVALFVQLAVALVGVGIVAAVELVARNS